MVDATEDIWVGSIRRRRDSKVWSYDGQPCALETGMY
jgi:hypothetical protein